MKIFVLTHNYNYNSEFRTQIAVGGQTAVGGQAARLSTIQDAQPDYALCTMHYALPWMLLPDSSLLAPHTGQGGKDKPLYLPDFDPDIRLFPSVAIRISRLGKDIATKFARRYYHEWAVCLCARGMQTLNRLQQLGMPLGAACSFDGSFVVGPWQEMADAIPDDVRFSDGAEEVVWEMSKLRTHVDEVVSRISTDNILKTGDIIVLGTPLEASLAARIGATITATATDQEVLYLRIK